MPPTASQIGESLRAWRERANIAREKAAPLVDTTTRTLARWEDGEAAPPADQFFGLVLAYGAVKDLSELLTEWKQVTPAANTSKAATGGRHR
jgi:transcriptional regulator with XRE-family HTH domain